MRGDKNSPTLKRTSESNRSLETSERSNRGKLRKEILYKLNKKQENQSNLRGSYKDKSTEDIIHKIKKEIETTIKSINEKQRDLESKLAMETSALTRGLCQFPNHTVKTRIPVSQELRHIQRKNQFKKQARKLILEDEKFGGRSKHVFNEEGDYSAQSDNSTLSCNLNASVFSNQDIKQRFITIRGNVRKNSLENNSSEDTVSQTPLSISSSSKPALTSSRRTSLVDDSFEWEEAQEGHLDSISSLKEVVLPLRGITRSLKRTDSNQTYIISRQAFNVNEEPTDIFESIVDEKPGCEQVDV